MVVASFTIFISFKRRALNRNGLFVGLISPLKHIYCLYTYMSCILFFIMWHQYETQLCFLSHERIPVHWSRPCVNIDMKISTDIDSILLVVGRSRCDKLWRMSCVCHFEKHLHRKERNEIYIATNASILSHAFTF